MSRTPDSPTGAGSFAGLDLDSLRFDDRGLIPAIAQDHAGGEVLMMAWMSRASIERTLQEGIVVYWSRSRNSFWRKGDTSGHVQRLVELRVDCDRDCLLLLVDQTGPACHTHRRSCFYTALRDGSEVEILDVMKT
ncbi:phosphoribosyl-AMP cyclohydrolase [Frigidibacter sp. MR17.24]|uniref:phosphoribosyl-AMP cyclohydrolase n=1 Tax=Frigidibacter sp. MR17.24 TaxID=3127345 RepID=UPI003012CCFB